MSKSRKQSSKKGKCDTIDDLFQTAEDSITSQPDCKYRMINIILLGVKNDAIDIVSFKNDKGVKMTMTFDDVINFSIMRMIMTSVHSNPYDFFMNHHKKITAHKGKDGDYEFNLKDGYTAEKMGDDLNTFVKRMAVIAQSYCGKIGVTVSDDESISQESPKKKSTKSTDSPTRMNKKALSKRRSANTKKKAATARKESSNESEDEPEQVIPKKKAVTKEESEDEPEYKIPKKKTVSKTTPKKKAASKKKTVSD